MIFFDMKLKTYLFIISTLFCTQLSVAQISVETDTIFTAIIEEPDIVSHNSFTNQIPQLKTFRWIKNVVDITPGWLSTVCDKNLCYVPSVDTAELELGPGASSIIDLHLYTNSIYEGYAFIEVKIEDLTDTNNSAYMYFIYDSAITPVNEPYSMQFDIYPNPSKGLFYIEDSNQPISSVAIFDMNGKQLLQLPFGQKKWIELFHLESGNYLMQLSNRNQEILGTKKII